MKPHPHIALPAGQTFSPEEMGERAEAFYAEIRNRRSVRAFSDRPVDERIIRHCIMAAGTAPSGANHQPWFFAAIGDPQRKRELRLRAEEEERAFYAGKGGKAWLEALQPLGTDDSKPYLEIAPWIIAVFGQRRGGVEPGEDRKNYYVPESVGIAVGFLLAALHHSGLASLVHTPAPMRFLNELCGRPKDEQSYLLVVAGHAADEATIPEHALKKKPFDAIASL